MNMNMEVTQVRLPVGIIKEVNKLVNKGLYSNKSDVIRDAVRKLVLEKQVGSIPNSGDSVEQIRNIRKKLSREKISLDDINRLGE